MNTTQVNLLEGYHLGTHTHTCTQSIAAALGFNLKIAFKYPVVEIFMQYPVYKYFVATTQWC